MKDLIKRIENELEFGDFAHEKEKEVIIHLYKKIEDILIKNAESHVDNHQELDMKYYKDKLSDEEKRIFLETQNVYGRDYALNLILEELYLYLMECRIYSTYDDFAD